MTRAKSVPMLAALLISASCGVRLTDQEYEKDEPRLACVPISVFVSDPDYREALKSRGVKASPVNPSLFGSPGVGGGTTLLNTLKPPRLPRRPSICASPALTSSLPRVAFIDPGRLADAGEVARPGLAVGLVLGGVALTTATVVGLETLGDKDRE